MVFVVGKQQASVAQELIRKKISMPGERSHQRLVGASQIGGCPYHLGESMLNSLKDKPEISESGLGAWIGTAVHEYLEHNLHLDGTEVHEAKVDIFDLEGYGKIRGHIDLCWRDAIWDYKVLGKASFSKMALEYRKDPSKIPTTQYRAQLHLYGYGRILQGYDVETVNIIAIPKLSNNFSDIKFYSEPYNQELVDAAIARTHKIWELVQEGRLEDVPRDDDCWDCRQF